MGFLKRFLSLGSSKHRKSKKKQSSANAQVDAEGRILPDKTAQDPDTSANRLLRSSSTKFSVMAEIDYTSLPPLPHSVQDLLSTPSLSPSPSLVTVATAPAVQRSGTYVVKVHGRTTHSRTEFPGANPPISPSKPRRKQHTVPVPPMPDAHSDDDGDDDGFEGHDRQPRLKDVNFTPKDTSRMYKLRRDPSVASLLNLYDDKGCLDSAIFENSVAEPASNSEPTEGREPTKRSGSTLRQLLSAPGAHFSNNTEGDISWAERLLDEQLRDDSPLSSPSTLDIQTPTDALFPDTLSAPRVATADATFSSLDSSINYPAISSMEVELSGSEEDAPIIEVAPVSKPVLPDPKTPQRASEVFGFLSRRNTITVHERDLPPLPQILTPDHTGDAQDVMNTHDNSLGENLDATHSANTSHSTQLTTSSDTNSQASHAQIQTATMTKLSSAFAASTTSLNLLRDPEVPTTNPASKEVFSHDTGATSLSAPSSHHTGSSLSASSSLKAPPSKIPRGPRPRPQSIHKHDSGNSNPEVHIAQDIAISQPAFSTFASTSATDPTPEEKARRSKREAFTNIPHRQHRRVTSHSSACEQDMHEREREPNRVPPKLPKSKSISTPTRLLQEAPSRRRSTKPAYTAYGKENTPSPPPPVPSGRASPGPSSIPVLGAAKTMKMLTPARHRVLIEPPSSASSSELSPVAREMMDDLRQQRVRARQVERRRGFLVRE